MPSTLVRQFSVVTTHITILLLFKVDSSVSFPALFQRYTLMCMLYCTNNFAWACSLTACTSALLKWKLRSGWSLSLHIEFHIDVMIFGKLHVAQRGMTPWLRSFDLNRKLSMKSRYVVVDWSLVLGVGWNFWDLLFSAPILWESLRMWNKVCAWDPLL